MTAASPPPTPDRPDSRRRRSLRGSVTLVSSVLAAVIAAIAFVLVVHRDWRLEDSRAVDVAMDLVDDQDRLITEQFDDGERLDVEPVGSDDAVARYGADGILLEAEGPLSDDVIEDIADTLELDTLGELDIVGDQTDIDGRTWTIAATGCIEADACGWLVVARPAPTFASHVVHRLGWLALWVLAAAILAGLAARWAVARSLGAVDAMRREVDEITAADLTRRVPVPATGDELQALAESFNATIERLERGVATQRRFTSDAAHELRSPLAGMRAVLEVGQRQPDRMPDSVADALDQVDRAGRLVDDLLVLARHDAATPRRRQAADLDELVRAEVRAAAARRPELTFDRSAVVAVQASVVASAVSRIAQNLLDNASAHARHVVRVRLSTITAADVVGRPVVQWELAVDDDGPGVPVGDRDRVFERFARLDEARTRHTGGTGLGLAIVRELVAEHGGTVGVGDSDLGGASFVVRAPVPLPG